ncbi:MAG: TVP38/TMEM64 family protein [Corynebacterium sp.]|uniref:TVP38/TMEM64 family protein n=1 Tax=Corynebacterium sp. TaxID=1720 RepID=UPI0026E0DBD5|nr:TVP38/TMEM64 family protein [Corynebacterium sp.]MDO5669721.1 TVP38/TMEM64 family protein [Corynebacterium sp.]
MKRFGQYFLALLSDAAGAVAAWSWARRIVVAGALAAFLAVTLLIDVPAITTLRQWSEAAGPWFVGLFWLAYVVITQFPVPRTILTLSSGLLFGPWMGIIVALTATTVAAALSLSVVRGLLGEWMAPRLRHPAVAGINARLEQRGWLAVTSLRMIAGVPFSIMNYAAALTSVPLGMFTVATLIGSAPGTVVTVVLGDALTGELDPLVIGLTVVLAVLGLVGLAVDQRLPVKSVT